MVPSTVSFFSIGSYSLAHDANIFPFPVMSEQQVQMKNAQY
jgi:hypothetical protein